jgi:hypothetical protein
MSRSVPVPEDLYHKAAALAAKDRISVDEFVSAALAHLVNTREFIESKAKLFNEGTFDQALNEIPDVEPEAHDRL